MKTIPNDLFFAHVEAELAEGRSVRFRVKGTSMTPLLRDGRDEVLVAPCRTDELRKGEVVLFRYHGRYVLHRIIDCRDNRLLLRGDGLCASCEVCTVLDVAGKVVRVHRPSGRIVYITSRRWRWTSGVWCAMPLWMRRIALRLVAIFPI